jgi:hypothetical protein
MRAKGRVAVAACMKEGEKMDVCGSSLNYDGIINWRSKTDKQWLNLKRGCCWWVRKVQSESGEICKAYFASFCVFK